MSEPIVYVKLENRLHSQYESIYKTVRGCWLDIYFYSDDFNFTEKKAFFFMFIRRLLDEKRIVFSPPVCLLEEAGKEIHYEFSGAGEPLIWKAATDEIIACLRQGFPASANNEQAPELVAFWYSDQCPQIGWVDLETGKIFCP